MVYLYTAMTALILAIGQTFWKKAAVNFPLYQQQGLSTLNAGAKTLLSPNFVFGATLYLLATLIYMWLFSKYPFYVVQITLISFGVVFSFLISQLIFKETITPLSILGIFIVLFGIYLIIRK